MIFAVTSRSSSSWPLNATATEEETQPSRAGVFFFLFFWLFPSPPPSGQLHQDRAGPGRAGPSRAGGVRGEVEGCRPRQSQRTRPKNDDFSYNFWEHHPVKMVLF